LHPKSIKALIGRIGRGRTRRVCGGGGFAGAAINGATFEQSLRAGAIGAATGAAFGYVGSNYAAGSMGNYTGHAVIGCASSIAQGGNCEQGAAAALVGKWVTNNTSGSGWNDFTRGIAAVVSGGVGSMITGGSFENGAKTAAYGYLFNHMQAVFRQAFSSSQMNPNGDIGHAVVTNVRDGLIATGELGADAVAACGLVAAPCRVGDAVIGLQKAGIDLVVNGDARTTSGLLAGESASRIQGAALNAANAHASPGNSLSRAFIQATSYVAGKLVEWNVMQTLKPNR
jgi:hypothetical protein